MLTGRVRFGPFEADLTSGELWRDGVLVPLQDLPFKVLAALVEQPNTLVTRAALTTHLWGTDTYVDATAGLNTAVAKLREALGDSADQPRYIETVPKRGYRFIGALDVAQGGGATVAQGFSPAIGGSVAQGFSPAIGANVAQGFSPAFPPVSRRLFIWTGVALAMLIAILAAAFQLRADRGRVRIAVVLFDNETGDAERQRLAQGLTDATVTELTADPRLAVIGNAAVLRTERPFRDIEKIRDAVNADYIVIGQVQTLDRATIVRTHLIRAADQSHLAVKISTLTAEGEATLQNDVSRTVRSAIAQAIGAR